MFEYDKELLQSQTQPWHHEEETPEHIIKNRNVKQPALTSAARKSNYGYTNIKLWISKKRKLWCANEFYTSLLQDY